jgi:hypothetical protein
MLGQCMVDVSLLQMWILLWSVPRDLLNLVETWWQCL